MPPDEPKAAWQLAVERNLQVARDRASGIEREAPSRDRRIERGGQGRGVQGAAAGKKGESQKPSAGRKGGGAKGGGENAGGNKVGGDKGGGGKGGAGGDNVRGIEGEAQLSTEFVGTSAVATDERVRDKDARPRTSPLGGDPEKRSGEAADAGRGVDQGGAHPHGTTQGELAGLSAVENRAGPRDDSGGGARAQGTTQGGLEGLSGVEKELVLLKRRWGAALVQESTPGQAKSVTKFSVTFAPTDPELPAEVGRTLTLR